MLDGHGNDHRFSLEKIYPQKKKRKKSTIYFHSHFNHAFARQPNYSNCYSLPIATM